MRGKATGSSCVKLNSQDHPRVCGEKPERKAPRRPRLGSPPRMRGKETDSRRQCCSAGITPAYAGKRHRETAQELFFRDHPRVCGEKNINVGIFHAGGGSPPRMRGKAALPPGAFCHIGITPAYAGKSRRCCELSRPLRDHPRVCGEKLRVPLKAACAMGSPPRMRGKERGAPARPPLPRITPAYAGKSVIRLNTTWYL